MVLAQENMALWTVESVLRDYHLGWLSRHISLIGRREVLSGKAKFGIFGDGKELPQLAMAHAFQKGDWRSGYYRDQTLMFAIGALTPQQFFAQLYAHTDLEAEPSTAGRSMNGHFGTRSLNPDGTWKDLTAQPNSSADISPTAGQMPRAVGLAYASRLYRALPELAQFTQFSNNGNEVTFITIGNASTAEGLFWESVNAIGVLKAPAVITVYDDGYGISVTNEHQMVKQDLSALLSGFQRELGGEGLDVYTVRGWDYPALLRTYAQAVQIARTQHVPAFVHVIEVTQPQGHSTSGSHERYKSAERLKFEQDFDGLRKFREWILAEGLANAAALDSLEAEAAQEAEAARKAAWDAYRAPILRERATLLGFLESLREQHPPQAPALGEIHKSLKNHPQPLRRDLYSSLHQALVVTRGQTSAARNTLLAWKREQDELQRERYSSHLLGETRSALQVPEVKPRYSEHSPVLYGFEVINAAFDAMLGRDPRVLAFGEDVGKLGDVNQGFKGLQEKYGELRVSDTGIREATILGQAIGLALRGLRPIAEIQYLDYLLYALQLMSDDLATFNWRTKGGQKAPVIVRTRGHRLEGIWHSGSPMAGIIHLVRGMHVLVPRNFVQAAGFYNTLLQADDPALVVEVLNGYRLKERLPDNIGEFTFPLGVPEVLRPGNDVTVVTYGACCRIVLQAAELLSAVGIETEVIDVQSLLPFDIHGKILESLKKTSRILFVDEDVPGGTTAYMLQEVIEKQGGFYWLDAAPRTLAAQAHRPAYGSDGDYWSKPNAEQVFDMVYAMLHEAEPRAYPQLGA